jgi:hypothetical protein
MWRCSGSTSRIGAIPLLLALLPRTAAFGIFSPTPLLPNVTSAGERAFANAFRWRDRQSLVRYAIAPDFCATMQPLLSERSSISSWLPWQESNFTTCERLTRVVRDAFTVWSRASPSVRFEEVSDRCEVERLWMPVPERHFTISPWCVKMENATGSSAVEWTESQTPLEETEPTPDICSHRTCWDCARADVVVGAFSQKNRLLGDQHARARVVRSELNPMRPVGTDGTAKVGGTIKRAMLQFNADDSYMDNGTVLGKCWKLETGVCDWVASASDSAKFSSDATSTFVWLLTLSICCCCVSILLCLRRLAYNLLSGYDLDRDGKLSFSEISYVLDEFIGEICFNCSCPHINDKDVSPFIGSLTIIETLASFPILYISLFWTVAVRSAHRAQRQLLHLRLLTSRTSHLPPLTPLLSSRVLAPPRRSRHLSFTRRRSRTASVAGTSPPPPRMRLGICSPSNTRGLQMAYPSFS